MGKLFLPVFTFIFSPLAIFTCYFYVLGLICDAPEACRPVLQIPLRTDGRHWDGQNDRSLLVMKTQKAHTRKSWALRRTGYLQQDSFHRPFNSSPRHIPIPPLPNSLLELWLPGLLESNFTQGPKWRQSILSNIPPDSLAIPSADSPLGFQSPFSLGFTPLTGVSLFLTPTLVPPLSPPP